MNSTRQPGSRFERYTGFVPDRHAPIKEEFARLAKHQGWNPRSNSYRIMYRQCLAAEFDICVSSIMTDDELESWQALCEFLGIEPPPPSITRCRKGLRSVHINLIDLVDRYRSDADGRVTRFPSRQALKDYTRTTGKYFPLDEAKESGIVKILLREIKR
ncbi:hypothetical protein MMC20_000846 [Loxospora ochrophaea]|nr:hypothetical protein [Loxospora ochrophaea]